YREDGVWTRLVETLSAEAAADPAARSALLAEASQVLHERLGQPAEAARVLGQAILANPEDASLRPKLADMFEALGEWSRVAAGLGEQPAPYGERRSKAPAPLPHRRAKVLTRLDRPADALAELQLAAKMHPTDPAILRDLAEASFARGDLDLAERTYRA